MRTYIFIPPLRKMTGGIAVLYQVAEHLNASGHEVYLVPRETAPALDTVAIPVCRWEDLSLTPDDIWLVPEGWVNALAPGLRANAQCHVYVQNWAYLLSALPDDVHWDQLAVKFIAVSDPVARFTEYVTGKQAPILRPGIDTSLFYPPEPALRDKTTITIAWMPRKNRALANQIRDILRARLRLTGITATINWQEIHGKSLPDVASCLRDADIFLASGFPEGCPLPPLEALSSGCILAGFTGLGGWDYMRQAMPEADNDNTRSAGTPFQRPVTGPEFTLRDVAWGPNALIAPDADVTAAAAALEQAVRWILDDAPQLDAMRKNAQETVRHYSMQAQKEAVAALWNQFIRQ